MSAACRGFTGCRGESTKRSWNRNRTVAKAAVLRALHPSNPRERSSLPTRKNVLLIVVDQWRGDLLPKLGAPGTWPRALRTPNIDALCEAGVTFRNHFT